MAEEDGGRGPPSWRSSPWSADPAAPPSPPAKEEEAGTPVGVWGGCGSARSLAAAVGGVGPPSSEDEGEEWLVGAWSRRQGRQGNSGECREGGVVRVGRRHSRFFAPDGEGAPGEGCCWGCWWWCRWLAEGVPGLASPGCALLPSSCCWDDCEPWGLAAASWVLPGETQPPPTLPLPWMPLLPPRPDESAREAGLFQGPLKRLYAQANGAHEASKPAITAH